MPSPEARAIRVAVVEDEPLFRGLLEHFLGRHPRIEVVGSFADGRSALASIPSLAPHVVTLDIELPGDLDGIRVGLALRRELPRLGVVVLSNHADPRFLSAIPSKDMQGWSYLLKKSAGDIGTFSRAVEGAADGVVVLDPAVVAAMRPRQGGPLDRLTRRQSDVLALLAQGLTNAAIGERLVIAEKSVENQLTAIYAELGIERGADALHPRVSAVLAYLRESRFTPIAAG